MNNLTIKTLDTTSGKIAIFWVVVQQLIVASSVIFVSKAIDFVSEDYREAIYYLALFCLTLVVVYIPYSLSMIYSEQWKYDAYNRFITEYATKAYLNDDKSERALNTHQSIISSESRTAFYDTIDAIGNLISLLLNYVFSVIAVVISVDITLLPYYLCSIIVMLLIQFKTKRSVSRYANLIQVSKNETMKRIFRISELASSRRFNTTMLGKFSHRHWRQKKLAINLERYTLQVNLLSSVITLSIVMLGNFHFIYESNFDISIISVVIVTMPRQVQIIQSSMGYLNALFKVNQCNQKMLNIIKIISSEQIEVHERIKLNIS